jgi:hypothetical protein
MSECHNKATENEVVEEIGRKIINVVYADDVRYSFDDIMNALIEVVIFQMSLVCFDCRNHIVNQIKHLLPTMAHTASEAASEFATSNDKPPRCH